MKKFMISKKGIIKHYIKFYSYLYIFQDDRQYYDSWYIMKLVSCTWKQKQSFDPHHNNSPTRNFSQAYFYYYYG